MRRLYVSLNGGIGNLLFQYAAALSISDRFNRSVVLAEFSPGLATRLQAYVGPLEFESIDRRSAPVLGSVVPDWVGGQARRLNQGFRFVHHLMFATSCGGFDPCPSSIEWRTMLLDGYFQHPTWYSESIDRVLQKLLAFRPPEFSAPLPGVVAVHLRRGDFVRLGWALPTEYYERALGMARDLGYTNALVLSDDRLASDLLGRNLRTQGWTILDPDRFGSLGSAGDFYLLANAEAMILSNSTFSWWAAKLGTFLRAEGGGHRLAPNHWIEGGDLLLEESWKLVEW